MQKLSLKKQADKGEGGLPPAVNSGGVKMR